MAASLVIGGLVWSYFQTPSTRQATYAPVIIIGFGMSVMYVMALAFITEVIGENKVSDLGRLPFYDTAHRLVTYRRLD